MKNYFDDLIENLYDFKISDEDKFFELLQKFKTSKYFQSKSLRPVTGSPLITREKIISDCKLILNVSEDVAENLSNELLKIYSEGNKGLTIDKVKTRYPDYDYHLPFPDINFFISFSSKKFPLQFKLDKGEYILKGIYIKSSLIEERIEYKIFLMMELYSDNKLIGKFLNSVPFTQKDFIEQDQTRIILAAHVMSYIFLKGITDCYLAGVRGQRNISFKNHNGQQVKLKYPSSVIVYRHKQYEPQESSGVKYDFYKGRNVIGHYRHFYVKTAQGKRIVDNTGHWVLDKERPEGGGKDEFGNRPGTDFFKGRTYVKPQYNDLEHNDFVRKYIKLENEKKEKFMRKKSNPSKSDLVKELKRLEMKKDSVQDELDYMLSEQYTESEMRSTINKWENLMDMINELKKEIEGVAIKSNPSRFLKKKFHSFKKSLKSNPSHLSAEEGYAEAEKILAAFIKHAGGKAVAMEIISEEVIGELDEFTEDGLNGYMVFGNREALIYVDDIEEPFVLYVDVYGGRPVLVWG